MEKSPLLTIVVINFFPTFSDICIHKCFFNFHFSKQSQIPGDIILKSFGEIVLTSLIISCGYFVLILSMRSKSQILTPYTCDAVPLKHFQFRYFETKKRWRDYVKSRTNRTWTKLNISKKYFRRLLFLIIFWYTCFCVDKCCNKWLICNFPENYLSRIFYFHHKAWRIFTVLIITYCLPKLFLYMNRNVSSVYNYYCSRFILKLFQLWNLFLLLFWISAWTFQS